MMMPHIATVAATVGGGVIGFYAMRGSRRERYLASGLGMVAGYAVAKIAANMVPALPSQSSAQNPPASA